MFSIQRFYNLGVWSNGGMDGQTDFHDQLCSAYKGFITLGSGLIDGRTDGRMDGWMDDAILCPFQQDISTQWMGDYKGCVKWNPVYD